MTPPLKWLDSRFRGNDEGCLRILDELGEGIDPVTQGISDEQGGYLE